MSILDRVAFVLQRIDTEDVAREYIRESCGLFFVLAGISAVVGVLVDPTAFIDAALYSGLAFWLRQTNNVIPAVLMLAASGFLVAASWLGGAVNVRGLIIRAIGVVLALRTIEATIKLPKMAGGGDAARAAAGARGASAGKVKVYG